jgi:hypothetical protein
MEGMRLYGAGDSEGSFDSNHEELATEEGSSAILPKRRKKTAGTQLSRAIVGHEGAEVPNGSSFGYGNKLTTGNG